MTTYKNKRNATVTPFTFTEQGVAMLSGILNSEVVIHVNIVIISTFVMIRKYALEYKKFNEKLLEREAKYDKKFSDVYEELKPHQKR
ncbi:MAG: hypothetical protein V4652_04220 [Bacteroidota bacterium]